MIGTSPRRKEDQRLLSGGGRFLDDLTREGLLHLGIVRSVEAHARVVRVDVARARAVPGVVAAWSAADLDDVAPHMPTAYGGAQKGRPWAQLCHRLRTSESGRLRQVDGGQGRGDRLRMPFMLPILTGLTRARSSSVKS
jgi:CO/xanthine dehydrogenase Mo-binding subunit